MSDEERHKLRMEAYAERKAQEREDADTAAKRKSAKQKTQQAAHRLQQFENEELAQNVVRFRIAGNQ
ncbi:hypothetical protein [Erwinia sp. S59]|uniref:hypothetical protein n=1 Tax=Erwinia sp. S59 TaxID=2769340 RepID=UPI00190C433D|nr:hypothetical protein [Erwinia sp. S59]MBK0092800.1 hypothetical protein [Erwinia sp. S59]